MLHADGILRGGAIFVMGLSVRRYFATSAFSPRVDGWVEFLVCVGLSVCKYSIGPYIYIYAMAAWRERRFIFVRCCVYTR